HRRSGLNHYAYVAKCFQNTSVSARADDYRRCTQGRSFPSSTTHPQAHYQNFPPPLLCSLSPAKKNSSVPLQQSPAIPRLWSRLLPDLTMPGKKWRFPTKFPVRECSCIDNTLQFYAATVHTSPALPHVQQWRRWFSSSFHRMKNLR